MAAAHEVQHHTSTGVDNRKLLMWVFLASECLFFGTLISTYLIFKGHPQTGPFPEDVFDIVLTSGSTFILLMSSLTMVLAVYAAQQGRLVMLRAMLMATIFMGLIFLGGQVYEFNHFNHLGLGLGQSQFSASFYVLTGFHGVHVGVGVLYLISLLIGSTRRNGIGKDRALWVDTAGLYWHFVDIVWIVIFTLVYLIP